MKQLTIEDNKKDTLLEQLNNIVRDLHVQRDTAENATIGVKGFLNNKKDFININTNNDELDLDDYTSDLINKETSPYKNSALLSKSNFDETNFSRISLRNPQGNKKEIVYNFSSKNPFGFFSLNQNEENDSQKSPILKLTNLNDKQKELIVELNHEHLFKVINMDLNLINDLNSINTLKINELDIKGFLSHCSRKYEEIQILKKEKEQIQKVLNEVTQENKKSKELVEDLASKINQIEPHVYNNLEDTFNYDTAKERELEKDLLIEEKERLDQKKKNLLNDIEDIKERYKEDVVLFSSYLEQVKRGIYISEDRIKPKNEFLNILRD